LFFAGIFTGADTYSEKPIIFAHIRYYRLHLTTYFLFKAKLEREARLELTMFSLEGCCFTNLATPALSNFKRKLGGLNQRHSGFGF
jgi:hypothetical protein